MPTVAHVVYIPMMLVLGVVLGYILAQRAAVSRKTAADTNAPVRRKETSLEAKNPDSA